MEQEVRGQGEYAWVGSPGHRQHTQSQYALLGQDEVRGTCTCKIEKRKKHKYTRKTGSASGDAILTSTKY